MGFRYDKSRVYLVKSCVFRTETRFSDRPYTPRPSSRVQWESENDLRRPSSRRSQIYDPRIEDEYDRSRRPSRIDPRVEIDRQRIGSGAYDARQEVGSGAGYNPNDRYGPDRYGTMSSGGGYPLRRAGSEYDWEERRFVAPNEMTAYERSRSQSPVGLPLVEPARSTLGPSLVDPTRPSYGLRDSDTYTATILRRQWKEDKDQRIQHKDSLGGRGRYRSTSPPIGADCTTYPPKTPKQIQ